MPSSTIESPFKFLDAYHKQDRDIFFGRTDEVEELFNRVYQTNLLLIYGPTGTGKTSIIECGLGNMFEDADWLPLNIRRGDNIVVSLEQALFAKARKKEKLKNKSISKQVHSLYLDYYKPIYLIFDQFEELFILGKEEEKQNFFWLLAELLQTNIQCKILLVMREEYIAHLDQYEKIVPDLFANRFRVEKMRREKIEEVIVKTAAHPKFEIGLDNEDVPELIIKNIQDELAQVDLVNLQVYLDRLYQNAKEHLGKKKKSICFDAALINRTGKLEDVLGRFLEDQLNAINDEMKKQGIQHDNLALKILEQLITSQETKQCRDTSIILQNLEDQGPKKITDKEFKMCIEELIQRRILKELP